MADTVKVWDAEGIERDVSPIDAKEIIANGGSATAPPAKPAKTGAKVVEEALDKPVVEEPKKDKKK